MRRRSAVLAIFLCGAFSTTGDAALISFQAATPLEGQYLTPNVPGFNRNFNGFELMARKRMADNWMMNSSFSYNDTKVNYGDFPGSQPSTAAAAITEDPTNREQRNGHRHRPAISAPSVDAGRRPATDRP